MTGSQRVNPHCLLKKCSESCHGTLLITPHWPGLTRVASSSQVEGQKMKALFCPDGKSSKCYFCRQRQEWLLERQLAGTTHSCHVTLGDRCSRCKCVTDVCCHHFYFPSTYALSLRTQEKDSQLWAPWDSAVWSLEARSKPCDCEVRCACWSLHPSKDSIQVF